MNAPRTDLSAGLQVISLLVARSTPLHDALIQAAQATGQRGLSRTWSRIAAKVKRGEPFDQAIMVEESAFPSGYAAVLARAACADNAAEVFIELAGHHDLREQMRSRLLGFMLPMALLLLGTVLFGGVWSGFIVPHFRQSYLLMELPQPVWLSPLISLIWVVPAGAGCAFLMHIYCLGGITGHHSVKRLADIALWLRSLALFLHSGMPLHEALELSRLTGAKSIQSDVQAGESLASALVAARNIPDSLRQLLARAERTGDLAAVTHRLGNLYYRFAVIRVQWMSSRLFPILLAVCALVAAAAVFTGYMTYFRTIHDAAEMAGL